MTRLKRFAWILLRDFLLFLLCLAIVLGPVSILVGFTIYVDRHAQWLLAYGVLALMLGAMAGIVGYVVYHFVRWIVQAWKASA